MLRNELSEHNKKLASAGKDAGVVTPFEYAIFQDEGYEGLNGWLGSRDLHDRKGLKKREKILDPMGSTELAANLPAEASIKKVQTHLKKKTGNSKASVSDSESGG
jgi:DNA-damage-inducible protein D